MSKVFRQETYNGFIKELDTIYTRENPCQFDEQWKCIASRLWKIVWDSCCTKSDWTTCSNLWATGCTTTNILCKTFYCPTAQESLSPSAQNTLSRMQDYLVYLLWWWSENTAKSFFYQSEKIIKKMLFPVAKKI